MDLNTILGLIIAFAIIDFVLWVSGSKWRFGWYKKED